VEELKVVKGVLTVAIVLSLVSVLGCSEIAGLTKSSSQQGPDIVRRAELAEKWQMDQTRVRVVAGDESLVLLRLTYGDKVEGYFYLEKGEDITFQIAGNSLMYEAQAPGTEVPAKLTSDRFAFVAIQEQGTTYTLTFRNTTDNDAVVFLELIYPVNGSLSFPIAAK